MKITRFLLLSATLFFAFSCSDNDEPTKSQEEQEQELEETSLSFSGSSSVVSVPSAMLNSEDEYAQRTAAYVLEANAMTSLFTYLTVPQNATKSTSKITASNGRVNANDVVLTYTWSNGQGGSIGYQVSNTADKNIFEIFMQEANSNVWLKYFHAEELKDKSEGFLRVYNIYDPTITANSVVVEYSWQRTGDNLKLITDTYLDEDFIVMTEVDINTKTKAGSIVYEINDVKESEMSWDAEGNGTWKEYDESGNLLASGDWTV